MRVNVVVLAGHIFGQRIIGEVVGVALYVIAYLEVVSLPVSQDLGCEGAVRHGLVSVTIFQLDSYGEIIDFRIWRWRVGSEVEMQELMLGMRKLGISLTLPLTEGTYEEGLCSIVVIGQVQIARVTLG